MQLNDARFPSYYSALFRRSLQVLRQVNTIYNDYEGRELNVNIYIIVRLFI